MSDTYVRYDYAWKTPGWTVQNPSYTQVSDAYSDPGLPDDVEKVRLFGEFMDFQTGRPLEGYLEIRCSDDLIYTTTQTRVMRDVRKIRFNRGGFDISLPATDANTLTPEFLYQARLTVAGTTMAFQFSLPAVNDLVNVNDLIPAPTGSLDLILPGFQDGVVLGSVPASLTVNLVTGADFKTVLNNTEDWADGALVTLHVGNLVWTAALDGDVASFDVDKAVADTVLDNALASLRVSIGSSDEVWAVGRVVRHGGIQ